MSKLRDQTAEKDLQAIVKLAAKRQPVTMRDITTARDVGLDKAGTFLRVCCLVPWLVVKKLDGGYTFLIDHELKALCELHRPGQAPDGITSLPVFLNNFRREITRRRKENNAKRERNYWNPTHSVKVELVHLLDWIEEQLDTVAPLGAGYNARISSGLKGTENVSNDIGGISAVDAAVSSGD